MLGPLHFCSDCYLVVLVGLLVVGVGAVADSVVFLEGFLSYYVASADLLSQHINEDLCLVLL